MRVKTARTEAYVKLTHRALKFGNIKVMRDWFICTFLCANVQVYVIL